MSGKITRLVKSLLFTSAYNRLYPLSEKNGIVEKINTYDYNLNDDFTADINSLYQYLLSDMSIEQINKEQYNRSLDKCYKTQKVKYKDKTTKKKTIEYVKVEKKGTFNQRDIQKLSSKIEELENQHSDIERLVDRLTAGEISEYDLPKLDRTLKANRFRATTYIFIIAVMVAIVAFILIFLH